MATGEPISRKCPFEKKECNSRTFALLTSVSDKSQNTHSYWFQIRIPKRPRYRKSVIWKSQNIQSVQKMGFSVLFLDKKLKITIYTNFDARSPNSGSKKRFRALFYQKLTKSQHRGFSNFRRFVRIQKNSDFNGHTECVLRNDPNM